MEYNSSPNLDGKVIFEENPMAEYLTITDLSGLVALSDCSAVVTVLDSGRQAYFNEMTGELVEKFSSHSVLSVTITKVKIHEVVSGSLPSEIELLLIGPPDSDENQTKLIKDKDYFLIISVLNEKNNLYKLRSSEKSMFFINDDFTITSVSAVDYCAKYDGVQLYDLVGDVKLSVFFTLQYSTARAPGQ